MPTQDSDKKELTAAVINTYSRPLHRCYEGELTYEEVVEKISKDEGVTGNPEFEEGFLCGIPNSVEAWVSNGDTVEISFFEPDDSAFVWVEISDGEEKKSQPDDNSQEIQGDGVVNKPTNTSEMNFSQCKAFYFYFYPLSEEIKGFLKVREFVYRVTAIEHEDSQELHLEEVKYRVCSGLLQYCSISFEDEKLSDEVKNQLRGMNTELEKIRTEYNPNITLEDLKKFRVPKTP
ncbi:hypothetical protein COEREDRAFT_84308 [Coemansia reversa NRRL 1564]|uniref:Uncharacterized protein n=1 Tax=Coemansia reversa (strain ATCC 12441 / NRRL 1564) TaxID=763665 RepID=A0A2G5BL24_COERN|nr:hypothetical protein COEREDRAFT_84308 [Coemansia reversa NRRL 1564]|eukprot:PIA19691.1 hypothetical protein COEREDRAFT_84308 [Coemansia reversa NRRL 1564]